jgi:hypothetical protein
MKLKLIFCAQGLILDRGTNNYSAFNILDEIASPNFPANFPPLEWLTVFEKEYQEEEQPTITFRTALNGETIHETKRKINFEGKRRTRLHIRFDGMPVSNPGDLELIALYKDEVLGSYTVDVKNIGPTAIKNHEQDSGQDEGQSAE